MTIDRAARHATITVRAPGVPVPEDIDSIVAAGASWWPLAMARELDDAILLAAHQRARRRHVDREDRRRRRPRSCRRCRARAPPHALVRAGDDRHAAANARPARRDLAHADCADRARLVLRRDAARARARRRSQLHARAARRRSGRPADRAFRPELRRIPDGERAARIAARFYDEAEPLQPRAQRDRRSN